jgi:hypothetical protein
MAAQYGWAIQGSCGHIIVDTVRRTQRRCIADWVDSFSGPHSNKWSYWRDEMGAKCVRVQLSIRRTKP